jgi:hypothetical protein
MRTQDVTSPVDAVAQRFVSFRDRYAHHYSVAHATGLSQGHAVFMAQCKRADRSIPRIPAPKSRHRRDAGARPGGRWRFRVQRTFQDGKSHAALDRYQARGWRAWHHHMALVMMAMPFMLEERAAAADTVPLLNILGRAAGASEMLALKCRSAR